MGLFIVWVIWFEGNSGVAFGVVLIFDVWLYYVYF